jgi:Recombinase
MWIGCKQRPPVRSSDIAAATTVATRAQRALAQKDHPDGVPLRERLEPGVTLGRRHGPDHGGSERAKYCSRRGWWRAGAGRSGEDGSIAAGEREIDPEEAAIVRRIFMEYSQGMSPRQIAARLNAEGVPSPRR